VVVPHLHTKRTVAKLETDHPEINRGLLENRSFVFLGTCLKKGHPKMPKNETLNFMVKPIL
jgi:hypothetical protein